jgi:hypothetical protein
VVFPDLVPGPGYDQVYPLYAEVCAVSQIRAEFTAYGGSAGHGVIYLKGVCRDGASKYPRLKLCDPGAADLSDPGSGTGVSVNKVLKNVNWVAIPGRQLFYYGNLKQDDVLDAEAGKAAIADAHEKGVFEGVEVHEKYLPGGEEEGADLKFLAENTLGTDYALNFGRSALCTRLPVTETMMEEIVGFLNGLNDEYASGEADYNWSGYSDNCVHVVHNSLAAADVWQPKAIRLVKFLQVFNMAIPSNEAVNLASRSTDFPLEDLGQVYNDHAMRSSLMKHDWLPTRQGALVSSIPVHQKNELYDTKVKMLVLEGPLSRSKTRKLDRMIADPRYTDLKSNLEWFRERYESILAQRPEGWNVAPEGDEFRQFRRKYYGYIEAQLADVRKRLLILEK